MLKRYVIITGGGIGSRMDSDIPKQFLPLGKWTVLMRTMQQFATSSNDIIVVLPEQYFKFWEELQEKYHFSIPHTLVGGGESRFDSVKNAMAYLPDEGLVAIHDAVRPIVSRELIKKSFYTANKYGSSIPVLPITDSLRMIEGKTSKPVNRKDFYSVQTPQVFFCKEIKKAYDQDYRLHFTDDATVFEAAGGEPRLIYGEEQNIKITMPIDLCLAESLVNKTMEVKLKVMQRSRIH